MCSLAEPHWVMQQALAGIGGHRAVDQGTARTLLLTRTSPGNRLHHFRRLLALWQSVVSPYSIPDLILSSSSSSSLPASHQSHPFPSSLLSPFIAIFPLPSFVCRISVWLALTPGFVSPLSLPQQLVHLVKTFRHRTTSTKTIASPSQTETKTQRGPRTSIASTRTHTRRSILYSRVNSPVFYFCILQLASISIYCLSFLLIPLRRQNNLPPIDRSSLLRGRNTISHHRKLFICPLSRPTHHGHRFRGFWF